MNTTNELEDMDTFFFSIAESAKKAAKKAAAGKPATDKKDAGMI
jgi:hypothetical protein